MERLKRLAESYNAVPPGTVLAYADEIAEGPGGRWQGAVWFLGCERYRAAIVSVDGCCPVALEPVWADSTVAKGAAMKMARFAACAYRRG